MKLQTLMLLTLIISACSAKQEPVLLEQPVETVKQEKVVTPKSVEKPVAKKVEKIEQENKALADKVEKQEQEITQYKVDQKKQTKMIEKLEQKFNAFYDKVAEITKSDDEEELKETLEPQAEKKEIETVTFTAQEQQEETFVVNEETKEVETKKEADSVIGEVAIEEKDEVKEHAESTKRRNIILGLFLLACISIGFAIYRFF